MKCQIIVFGKTSNKNSKKLEEEYIKRISPFSSVEYIVLNEEKMAKTISEEHIKEKEADRFFTSYSKNNFLIACHVKGKSLTSPQFAEQIEKISLQFSGVTFVIGGSLGLSNTILEKAHLQLSFSAMTFPHDLFRIFLFEQIYRAFMISNNRKYHR